MTTAWADGSAGARPAPGGEAKREYVEQLRQLERDLHPHSADGGLLGQAWAFVYRTLTGIEAAEADWCAHQRGFDASGCCFTCGDYNPALSALPGAAASGREDERHELASEMRTLAHHFKEEGRLAQSELIYRAADLLAALPAATTSGERRKAAVHAARSAFLAANVTDLNNGFAVVDAIADAVLAVAALPGAAPDNGRLTEAMENVQYFVDSYAGEPHPFTFSPLDSKRMADDLRVVLAALRARSAPRPGGQAAGEGVRLIATERQRQITAEDWSPEHDDEHWRGELAQAASCYARTDRMRVEAWPWDRDWWKPTPADRVRELVKAGALIVAEIDRLLRAAERGTGGES